MGLWWLVREWTSHLHRQKNIFLVRSGFGGQYQISFCQVNLVCQPNIHSQHFTAMKTLEYWFAWTTLNLNVAFTLCKEKHPLLRKSFSSLTCPSKQPLFLPPFPRNAAFHLRLPEATRWNGWEGRSGPSRMASTMNLELPTCFPYLGAWGVVFCLFSFKGDWDTREDMHGGKTCHMAHHGFHVCLSRFGLCSCMRLSCRVLISVANCWTSSTRTKTYLLPSAASMGLDRRLA